jgi:ABC-type transporter Mla MlaB component
MTPLALPALLTHDQAAACAQSLGLGIRAEQSDRVVIDGQTTKLRELANLYGIGELLQNQSVSDTRA